LIVAFDLEGTLVDAELFPALGEYNGKKPELDDITDRAMRGELDFRASLDMRLELIHNMSIDSVKEVSESLPLTRGAQETVSKIMDLGGVPIIVTGGFEVLASRVAGELGIEYVCCNRFTVEEKKITGFKEPVITGKGKSEKLLGLASWLGVQPKRCVAIGDGANDIPMMQSCGLSIAFNAREKVLRTATVSISGKDLRQVLPHIEEFCAMMDRRELVINQI